MWKDLPEKYLVSIKVFQERGASGQNG